MTTSDSPAEKSLTEIVGPIASDVLVADGITTLAELRDTDTQDVTDAIYIARAEAQQNARNEREAGEPNGVALRIARALDGISAYGVRQWQATARTELLRGTPRTPKLYVAISNLSIESIQPNLEVKSGEQVDLWWKSDAEIAQMIAAHVIASPDAHSHLIVNAAWLPDPVKARCAEVGVFTLEEFLSGRGEFMGESVELAARLGVSAENIAHWMDTARAVIANENMASPAEGDVGPIATDGQAAIQADDHPAVAGNPPGA